MDQTTGRTAQRSSARRKRKGKGSLSPRHETLGGRVSLPARKRKAAPEARGTKDCQPSRRPRTSIDAIQVTSYNVEDHVEYYIGCTACGYGAGGAKSVTDLYKVLSYLAVANNCTHLEKHIELIEDTTIRDQVMASLSHIRNIVEN